MVQLGAALAGGTLLAPLRAVLAQQPQGSAAAARSFDGMTALVSGSTDGLGRAVATGLATGGASLIVHGRNRERGAEVVEDITSRGGRAVFYPADFASLAQVRELAATVLANHSRLDLLINNAGIGSANAGGSRDRQVSGDGHELRFQVNYLAGFLLTHLLLPRIRASVPARIVNVASVGQQAIDFENVMLERGYDGGRAYSQSKLAQIMFTIDLAGELAGSGVTVNALHPATFMDTTMVRRSGNQPRATVDEGAESVMFLATAAELEGRSGLYFNQTREARANAQAYDAEARAQLRALSLDLTGLG